MKSYNQPSINVRLYLDFTNTLSYKGRIEESASTFLKKMIELKADIHIISNICRSNIENDLKATSLSSEQVKKIYIHGFEELSNICLKDRVFSNKGNMVKKIEESQPPAKCTVICDDTAYQLEDMENAVIKNRTAILTFCSWNRFNWQEITDNIEQRILKKPTLKQQIFSFFYCCFSPPRRDESVDKQAIKNTSFTKKS